MTDTEFLTAEQVEDRDENARGRIVSHCRLIRDLASTLSDRREASIYVRYAEDIAARALMPKPLG